jgi:ribosome biogenesis GTPase / thiamine phosphate phosphatase
LPDGTILRCLSGTYEVITGNGIYICRPRGLFRLKKISPLTGDRVEVGLIDENEREGYILSVYKRKNQLMRPRVANIDQTCIVISKHMPEADLVLTDKLLIAAYDLDLEAVICENKTDLDGGSSGNGVLDEYTLAGIKTVRISAKDNINMEELADCMKGKITVLAGQSGAGKSSIINRISGRTDADTGEVSRKNEKGRHTTTHAELIGLKNGGYIIDTPGFSDYDIGNIRYQALDMLYPEFRSCRGTCRFNGCAHVSEPGCGVKQAVADGKIGPGRYARYVMFHGYLKDREASKYKQGR